MRLELFGVVLFGIFASCWTLSLYDSSPGSGSGLEVRMKSQKVESLLEQDKNEILLESEKSSSSQRIYSETRERQSGRKKREESETPEADDSEKECDGVTEDEINRLNIALQEALRNISSLYSNSILRVPEESNNDGGTTDSSEQDQCQMWILEMKEATEEISNLAELLQGKILDSQTEEKSDSDLGIQRLDKALDVETRKLHKLAAQLENKLDNKWNVTMSRTIFEVYLLTEEVDELKTDILGPVKKARGRNYNLLISEIRLGNLAIPNSFVETSNKSNDALVLKSLIKEAYDGENLDYFRNTLAFSRQLSLSLDEISYPALFEKVNGSTETGGHRSNPRVLFPLSFRVGESILMHKNSNLSVPSILTETDEKLDGLIIKEILEPWSKNIRSGDFTLIRQFEEQGSESESQSQVELNGLRMFLRLLVKTVYGNSSDNFQATLDFVTVFKSPRVRSSGLLELYDLWNIERDHGTRLAFQVKKLLDSPEIRETEDEEVIQAEMTTVKAALPNWERLAVWGGGSCHIQSYENDEYMYTPNDYYKRSKDKRELFTSTFENFDNTTEWTFQANPDSADQGRTFHIRNLAYEDETIISNGKDAVYLRNGIAIPSESHSADWIIERFKVDDSYLFTIQNQRNGRYLYPGDMSRAWDSERRRVFATSESEFDPSSNEHIWNLRCDKV